MYNTLSSYHTISTSTFYHNPLLRRIISRNPIMLNPCLSASSESFLCHLQQWLHIPVKEKLLSMLGSQISPIKWTLVIIQVARQLLPRVIPETYIEISHCFWTGSGYPLIPTRTFTDSTTMCSYNTLVAGLFLQSTLVDWWCFFGFMATWILASTASLQFNDKLGLCG